MISWTITIISVDSTTDPTVVVDKTDLEIAFQTAMNKITQCYPNCRDICQFLYDGSDANSAIIVYGDRSVTQETVNTTVNRLNTLTEALVGDENVNQEEF